MSLGWRFLRAEELDDGRLVRLTLAAPKGNVLTSAVMAELDEAVQAYASDPHLCALVLAADGKAFSYGASVEEHQQEQAPAMLACFHGLVRKLASFPVPVVAAVDGACLGGAFELVLACHVVLATRRARFACPEIKLGVLPPVLAAAGHLRLPAPVVERLLVTGDELSAEEAHQLGFVAALLDDDAAARAVEWCRAKLLPLSAHALRQSVAAVRRANGLLRALDEELAAAERRYLEHIVTSADGNEGIAAFLEKRPPRWEDR